MAMQTEIRSCGKFSGEEVRSLVTGPFPDPRTLGMPDTLLNKVLEYRTRLGLSFAAIHQPERRRKQTTTAATRTPNTASRVSDDWRRQQLDKHLAGAEVDLSLIRLPAAALIFPNPPEPGADFSFTAPRIPRSVSQAFARRADRIGFGHIRFHDLRGIHSTALLDAGIPVHTVAQRIGDDPATLLRNYTKRKRSKTADEKLSGAIGALAAGFLRP